MPLLVDDAIAARLEKLELDFNAYGVDPFGVSKKHLAVAFSALAFLYRSYFRVKSFGHENVPARGRAMLVGNHSGGVAIDGAMVLASMFLELDPPRLAQGMAEKFLNKMPFASTWTNRTGQFTGLPEHAERLLHEERLLMVFPEGARGTAKLYTERHTLVQFGSGFIRLALKTGTPIIPFAFLGGGEAFPTIANAYALGALFGVPYIPIPAHLVPVPIPVPLAIEYGKPMVFRGTGSEEDEVIGEYVDDVKEEIDRLLTQGLERREGR